MQELFEAKRTTEANRRRQEELSAMIGRKTAKKRPLWPVWAGAAAAAVFAAVLLMPPFFSYDEEMPLIAQAEPATFIDAESDATITLQLPTTTPINHKHNQTKVVPHEVTVEQLLVESIEAIEENIPEEEPFVEEAAKTPQPETAAPVRRRLTNNLACVKGCARPKSNTQEKTLQWNTQQEAQGVTLFAMN